MALIRCAECEARPTDNAMACRKCATPIQVSRNKEKSRGSTACRCLIVVLVIGAIIGALVASQWRRSSTPRPRPSSGAQPTRPTPVPPYEVVSTRDVSYANVVRKSYRVRVPRQMTEQELTAIAEQMIRQATSRQKINAITIHFFLPDTDIKGAFTAGQATWAPGGDWAKASTNLAPKLVVETGGAMRDLFSQIKKVERLSEAKRREIFWLIVQAEDRAREEAEARYPLRPESHLRVGQVFQLAKETPLMPELEPSDPMAALLRMKTLAAGSYIKVQRISIKEGDPWYQVEGYSSSGYRVATGWIKSMALWGQAQGDPLARLRKQADLEHSLATRYKEHISRGYGVTSQEMRHIGVEGLVKGWPKP